MNYLFLAFWLGFDSTTEVMPWGHILRSCPGVIFWGHAEWTTPGSYLLQFNHMTKFYLMIYDHKCIVYFRLNLSFRICVCLKWDWWVGSVWPGTLAASRFIYALKKRPFKPAFINGGKNLHLWICQSQIFIFPNKNFTHFQITNWFFFSNFANF